VRATAIVVAVLLLGGIGAARAEAVTWDEAAAAQSYPVYQPARTLGLAGSVRTDLCGPGFITAKYRARGHRARLQIDEGSPRICGNPGESRTVKRVRIRGHRTAIGVFCRNARCRMKVKDGERYGWVAGVKAGRTLVVVQAFHVSLKTFLKIARSLERVDLARPTVHLSSVLSPDRHTWCTISRARAWCDTQTDYPAHFPEHSGEVHRDGSVAFCSGVDVNTLCTQNWDAHAPALRVGQRTQRSGYTCEAVLADTVTCTRKGDGFTTNRTGVAEV
jgi:hypothetical protein